jgi:hypothetical protein
MEHVAGCPILVPSLDWFNPDLNIWPKKRLTMPSVNINPDVDQLWVIKG